MQHKNKPTTDSFPPSNVWRKKYACKKNKGPHTYAIVSVHNRLYYWGKRGTATYFSSKLSPTDMGNYVTSNVEWECTGCKKKETEWLSSDDSHSLFPSRYNKKLNPFRQHAPFIPLN